MACSFHLGRIDMADPEGVEAEGERVREVDWMEESAGEELCSVSSRLEEGSVGHLGGSFLKLSRGECSRAGQGAAAECCSFSVQCSMKQHCSSLLSLCRPPAKSCMPRLAAPSLRYNQLPGSGNMESCQIRQALKQAHSVMLCALLQQQ